MPCWTVCILHRFASWLIMQRFCSFGLNHISFQKEELGVPLRCFGCHWMHASIRLAYAFLGLLRKRFDKTADKFSMLVGQAYSSDVSRKCSSYLVFRLLDPILWSVSFFRHGNCLQKCKFLWQRRKWGGGGDSGSSTLNTCEIWHAFTNGYHLVLVT